MRFLQISIIILFVLLQGCGGKSSPVTTPTSPADTPSHLTDSQTMIPTNRYMWGVWDVRISEDRDTVEIIPDRNSTMHFNTVRLMEEVPCTTCIVIIIKQLIPPDVLSVDFRLQHPFPGPVNLSAFDLRGIIINGADYKFPANNRAVGMGHDKLVLLDPDGYTSLFNPTEFPEDSGVPPILRYFPGKLELDGDLSSTLNPFIAYSRDLPRRVFYTASAETRNIHVRLPDGPVEFGYAVDASWMPVDYVINPIFDFPPEANCVEAYRIELPDYMEVNSGEMSEVVVEIFDHQGIETISSVTAEAPEIFSGEIPFDFVESTGVESCTYSGEITNELNAVPGNYPILFRVTDKFLDDIHGQVDAYQIGEVTVVEPPKVDPIAIADADPLSVYTGDQVHFFDDGSYDPDGGDIVLFEWDWENDGLPDETGEDNFHSWTDPGTYEVQFRVTDDEGATDVLDEPIVIEVIDETVGGWAVHAGGTDSDVGRSITTLSDGSTVVTGNFKGSATFGEGNPNETVLVSHGGDDIFLARYNPDSTLAWVTHAGGPGTDAGSGISALSDDSIGLIGWIQSTAIFGEGEPNETVLVSIASTDIFVARYNSDGTFAWANSSGGKGHDEGRGITALSDDTLAVTGNFRDKVVFGKGDPNETVLHSDGYHSDIFIARYNQDGSLIWVKRAGGNDFDVGQGISAFSDDSVVVVGHFQINGTFGNGDPNQTVIWSYGLFDSFIARYNSDGSLAWAKHSGGVESDSGLGVTTLSDDSSVVTGYFTGTATFGDGDPNETVIGSYGSNDIYIARYYSDGSLAWVKHAGGTDSDIGRGITALPDGSIVATGGFSTTATFGDSDPNETVIGSYGADDIFIARYYPDGSLAWAKHAGGTEADVGLGITSLSDNSSVMTGYFTTEATFEEGEPNETILISYGIPDIFVALYAP